MEISTDRIERYGLTEREREVLLAVAAGWSNSEIATSLVISEHTVKSHVAAVLTKTGCTNRVRAASLAYDLGVITPDPSRHSRQE